VTLGNTSCHHCLILQNVWNACNTESDRIDCCIDLSIHSIGNQRRVYQLSVLRVPLNLYLVQPILVKQGSELCRVRQVVQWKVYGTNWWIDSVAYDVKNTFDRPLKFEGRSLAWCRKILRRFVLGDSTLRSSSIIFSKCGLETPTCWYLVSKPVE
jgi:hypothetical protein